MKSNNVQETAKKMQAYLLPFWFASECINLMENVKKDVSNCRRVYLFLASSTLEAYGKSFMCLRWGKEDKFNFEEINKRVLTFGHDLDRIYHYQGVGKDFLSAAGIKKVKLSKQRSNNKVNYHRFEFYTEKDEIIVYPAESLKYGVLAGKRNDSIILEEIKLLDLCKSVRSAVLSEAKKNKFLK